jgi:predicted nucleic acid-binding Zn ribbon protein
VPTDDRPGRRHCREHVGDDALSDDALSVVGTGAAPNADVATSDVTSGDKPSVVDDPAADTADVAAASALARAREAARAKGLRPGSRPMRKRRAPGQQGQDSAGSTGAGRDPALLGDQMDRLLLDRGWNVDVAIGAVMGRWADIVGSNVAEHCKPVTFSDGVLTVRADSTAWTTQMRLMSSSILGRLDTEVGKDAVTELRVQGPSAPSWNRGPRKSTGPGPRDTYG